MLNSIPSSLDNSQTEPQKTNETTSSQNCNNTHVVCSLSSSKYGLYLAGIDEYRNKPGFNLSQESEVFVGRVEKHI